MSLFELDILDLLSRVLHNQNVISSIGQFPFDWNLNRWEKIWFFPHCTNCLKLCNSLINHQNKELIPISLIIDLMKECNNVDG